MENNRDENVRPHATPTVTLVLKTRRFEVEKQKLMNKSQYFAALLSRNYLEYNQKEHIINYDISPIILQNFIHWIHTDKLDTSAIHSDLEEVDHLILLWKLSILFNVYNLEKVVTDMLESRVSPKHALKIWLLAQEFNSNTLQDLSLDVCLDRFNDLPLNSIYKLSRENFLKLIGSINIRSTKSYVLNITHEWMDYNDDLTISLDIIEKHKHAKILHSIVSCENSDNINSEHFIHCWDGNDFFELTSFNYPQDIIDRSIGQNILVGMQITGRRFDLYLCGGEFGKGSNVFNTNVCRYSLISKKWYLQTVMPVVRRDMIAVILKNKLLLVGGRGRNLKKLQSVDIYDIDTDTWTQGAIIPRKFASIPGHSIFNEKLILHGNKCIFTYNPDQDVWKEHKMSNLFRNSPDISENMPIVAFKTMPCYIDVINPNEMVLRTVRECMTCNKNCNCLIIRRWLGKKLDRDRFEPEIRTVGFLHASSMEISLQKLEKLQRSEFQTVFMCMDLKYLVDTLHLRSIPIQNPNKFGSFRSSNSRRNFFLLQNPAHLHTTNLDDI